MQIRRALGAGAAMLVVAAGPVAASYHPGSETTTTTTSSTTTTTRPTTTTTTTRPPQSTTSTTAEPATTTTTAPPPATQATTVNNPTPRPGDAVAVATPSRDENIASEDDTVSVGLVPASGGAAIEPVVRTLTDDDGNVTGLDVTVPNDTPPGVYFIQVVVTSPTGRPRVLIAPIVVRRTRAAAASLPDDRGVAGVDYWVDQPVAEVAPELQAIRTTITSVGEEEAIVKAVLEDHAQLSVADGNLILSRSLGDERPDDSRPLVAALAVGVAGVGLLVLRRRTPAIARKVGK